MLSTFYFLYYCKFVEFFFSLSLCILIKVWSVEDRINFLFGGEMYILTQHFMPQFSCPLSLLSIEILQGSFHLRSRRAGSLSGAVTVHRIYLVLQPFLWVMAESADDAEWVGSGTLFISMLFFCVFWTFYCSCPLLFAILVISVSLNQYIHINKREKNLFLTNMIHGTLLLNFYIFFYF